MAIQFDYIPKASDTEILREAEAIWEAVKKITDRDSEFFIGKAKEAIVAAQASHLSTVVETYAEAIARGKTIDWVEGRLDGLGLCDRQVYEVKSPVVQRLAEVLEGTH